MKQVRKSVLLPHSPHEIYTLVTDIEAYPRFLPWCERAQVLARDEHGITARLQLAFAGLSQSFTTRNEQVADRSVHVSLVDGPFSALEGNWLFTALPLPQGGTGCKVDFELAYSFANLMLEAAISPVFDRIADTFVDSFVARADQVHGR